MNAQLFISSLLICIISHSAQGQESISLEIMPQQEANWTFEGIGQWDVKNNVLEIKENSINRDPFSAPSARAIYDKSTFTSFNLTVEIKSNAPLAEIKGDMVIIFGYQSSTQFYYAHLTGAVDSIHNGVFLVDNADRHKVDFTEFEPVLTDREWHIIRLARDIETGSISIFRDAEKEPIMRVQDRTFLEGKIGFGSFNDTGEIRNITVTSYN